MKVDKINNIYDHRYGHSQITKDCRRKKIKSNCARVTSVPFQHKKDSKFSKSDASTSSILQWKVTLQDRVFS